jgi:DNA-binding response OmpR family regulator
MRVLVIEDDADLARQLKDCLGEAGYAVDLAADGEEGHYLGANEPYDAVVLDLGLPVIDGITVLERWRQEGHRMPVLILTARDRWSEKVAGFDAGADDYVAKPFHMEEVLARLRALVRRAAGHASAELTRMKKIRARNWSGGCSNTKSSATPPRCSTNASWSRRPRSPGPEDLNSSKAISNRKSP